MADKEQRVQVRPETTSDTMVRALNWLAYRRAILPFDEASEAAHDYAATKIAEGDLLYIGVFEDMAINVLPSAGQTWGQTDIPDKDPFQTEQDIGLSIVVTYIEEIIMNLDCATPLPHDTKYAELEGGPFSPMSYAIESRSDGDYSTILVSAYIKNVVQSAGRMQGINPEERFEIMYSSDSYERFTAQTQDGSFNPDVFNALDLANSLRAATEHYCQRAPQSATALS